MARASKGLAGMTAGFLATGKGLLGLAGGVGMKDGCSSGTSSTLGAGLRGGATKITDNHGKLWSE